MSAVCLALLCSAPASAAPDCTQTSHTVWTCVTSGHTAIVTSPNPALVNPSPGWVVNSGTPVIGLGGGGFWLGF
jgi:carbamate kinase